MANLIEKRPATLSGKVLYREHKTTWLIQENQVVDQEFNIYPLGEWVDITNFPFYTPAIMQVFTGNDSLKEGLAIGILSPDKVKVNLFSLGENGITLITRKDHESGQLLVKFERRNKE